MNHHKTALLAFTLILTSCSQHFKIPYQTDSIGKTLGWIDENCFSSQKPNLSKGMEIQVIVLDTPQSISSATIIGPANPKTCNPLLADRRSINLSAGHSFYQVRSKTKIDLAIGIIGNSSTPMINNDVVEVDLGGNGNLKQFTFCTTAEGIRFEMREASHNDGKPEWEGYYHLGYDIESSCP